VTADELPSWRAGATRDALTGFLDALAEVAPEDRVAVFDNDGTLWCEKPEYPQYEFFVDALRAAVAQDPDVGDRPEYRALLDGDRSEIAALGLPRIALALADLFAGIEAARFEMLVRAFFERARHPRLGRPLSGIVYQPMVELIGALQARGATVCIVTGGGTEFVRAMSEALYGVPPERVVGTMVRYRYERVDAMPTLLRTAELDGPANEGPAKIEAMQRHLGRRPIFAAGNSHGDREMLEYARATSPSLALLIDHDDADREYAYESVAGTIAADEPITAVARREGWVVVSMRDDWSQVFPTGSADGS
jgi:phosphoserine phosphatase